VLPVGDVAVSALCTVSALVDKPLTLLPSEAVLFIVSETLDEEIVEPRRHHSACNFGKYMVVFGGISSKNQHFNDLKYLDLKELKWYNKEYKYSDSELERFLEGGLARHAMVAQFNQHDSYPLYSNNYDIREGLYIFGGSNQGGEFSTLLQLRLNKYIPVMHRLEPSGLPPSSVEPLVHRQN